MRGEPLINAIEAKFPQWTASICDGHLTMVIGLGQSIRRITVPIPENTELPAMVKALETLTGKRCYACGLELKEESGT